MSRPAIRQGLVGLVGLAAVGGLSWALGVPVALAVGLYLLAVAAWLFRGLHALGGWAPGALGSYAFAVAAQGLLLALPFVDSFDVWLTGLTGFGATVGLVLAACQPFLDRAQVVDPADETPDDRRPLRYEGRPLDRAGLTLLLAYSQVVVAANALITWHTFQSH